MERRKALAVAGAATLALGSAIVAAGALAGISVLGLGGASSAQASTSAGLGAGSSNTQSRVIVRKRNVYDRYVIDVPTTTGWTTANAEPATGWASGPTPAVATSPSPTTTTPSAGNDESPETDPPTTQAPSTSTSAAPTTTSPPTTVPTTTTTIRPRGVPKDWPPGEPIPPVPPNCREQQLTLDGIWHCDD